MANYVTLDDIRTEAGFQGNEYITDEAIGERRDDARSEVDGALANAGYTLPLSYVPMIVRNIAKLLAAGYLLLTDYGPGADGTNKEGKAKIDLANELFKRILSGKVALLDASGVPLTKTGGVRGYPDATTEPIFKMSDKY